MYPKVWKSCNLRSIVAIPENLISGIMPFRTNIQLIQVVLSSFESKWPIHGRYIPWPVVLHMNTINARDQGELLYSILSNPVLIMSSDTVEG